jgi:hypothetical protein
VGTVWLSWSIDMTWREEQRTNGGTKARQEQSRRSLARQACILISPAAGSALGSKGMPDCRAGLRTDLPVQRPRPARRSFGWIRRTTARLRRKCFGGRCSVQTSTIRNVYSRHNCGANQPTMGGLPSLPQFGLTAKIDIPPSVGCTAAIVPQQRRSSMALERQ